ncbi:MAG TPA: long-chain-fatty-acid--CoA ligase [Aliidongia sp.]|uniref:long-chain-fatty-acid--CoA ligase n=1 Tax=Aliidongia sp. TaxID=1914230 RepID=UPI002DDD5743|nr:long-chain-fatty-acid--CoA ligase [Aliidongia sp.]HEV2677555.1 long-chain-fatty-acid--CoA ligase [Aliidongia sp.]
MAEQNLQRNLISRVNVGDLLVRSAARSPKQIAIVDGDRRLGYRALNDWVNRTAHGLAALGYQRGDALGLMSTNNAEFLATYFACAKLGLICVPINLFWRHTELAYVLGHAAIKGMVVEAGLLDQLQPALAECSTVDHVVVIGDRPEAAVAGRQSLGFDDLQDGMPAAEPEALVEDRDPISYLYTSGTTSAPKGVVSSHLAIYLESLGVALDTRMTADDRVTAILPLFHTAQLNVIATPAIAVGATIFIQRGFDAARVAHLIEAERLTLLFALPMMYRALLEQLARESRDVASLRLAIYAMAPMPTHELRNAIDKLGCDFALMFGQTEMNPLSAYFRPEHQLSHPGAVGTPSVNVQIAIMDPAGGFLAEGQSGEIVYRSPQVLTGYLHNPEATDAAFAGGWFHSGDSGYFDADGILWFEDRFKDVIKSGGENVASIEVEKALYAADPAVQEVAVVGLPHDRWDEAVTAVVVVKTGEALDEKTLLTKVRDHLSPFKCPKRVIFTEALPKTATGKIQKAKLRKDLVDFYRTDK